MMEIDTKPICFRKLGLCEVCASEEANYTCPKCEVKTCSIACVSVHKQELSCDGVRDRVSFKPIHKFGTMDLQNDYILLEEISRNLTAIRKDSLKQSFRRTGYLPKQIRLQTAARLREVTLQFLPQHFSSHRSNTTYLNWKTHELFWRINWVFPQADNFCISDERVLDTTRLSTAVNKHLDSENSLLYYQAAGLAGLVLLLKAERVSGGKRFYELDPCSNIQENLKGKLILEFPVIYVVLKDHKFIYDIIDPDEEESLAEKNKHWRNDRHHSTIDNEKKPISENTNFLFSTDNEVKQEESENRHSPAISYEFDY